MKYKFFLFFFLNIISSQAQEISIQIIEESPIITITREQEPEIWQTFAPALNEPNQLNISLATFRDIETGKLYKVVNITSADLADLPDSEGLGLTYDKIPKKILNRIIKLCNAIR